MLCRKKCSMFSLAFSLALLQANYVVTLGALRAHWRIAKGETPLAGDYLFFFKNHLLKAIGLSLMITLKLLAWMLPGIALMLLVFLIESIVLVWIGGILVLALAIPAGIRYTLIPYCMVENPELSIREALTTGIGLMEKKKWPLVCLWFSTEGWLMIAVLALNMAIPALRQWFFSVPLTLLSAPLIVYSNVSIVLFFQSLRRRAGK